MLSLGYHDDGKGEPCSHTIGIGQNDCLVDAVPNGPVLYSYDITSLSGYGATKEEALADLRNTYKYVMEQLTAFGEKLNSDEYIKENPEFLIEVDCFGKPI